MLTNIKQTSSEDDRACVDISKDDIRMYTLLIHISRATRKDGKKFFVCAYIFYFV